MGLGTERPARSPWTAARARMDHDGSMSCDPPVKLCVECHSRPGLCGSLNRLCWERAHEEGGADTSRGSATLLLVASWHPVALCVHTCNFTPPNNRGRTNLWRAVLNRLFCSPVSNQSKSVALIKDPVERDALLCSSCH